jgi:cell division protein FtsW (lipid II flippase)
MTQYVDTIRSSRRRRRNLPVARRDDASVLARLDWVLLPRPPPWSGMGSGPSRDHARRRPGQRELLRPPPGRVRAAGIVLMVIAMLIDPQWYRRAKVPPRVMIAMMVLVALVGTVARGSRRWIDLSFFRFQPSEFGKVLFVLVIAAVLADRIKRIDEIGTPLLAIVLSVPPVLLVMLQPDLGSGLVYVAALAACLFVAGVRWLHLAVLGVMTVLVAVAALWMLPAFGVEVLKPYQTARLTGFTNPDEDPRGSTYNVRQSITAVGAGGFSGRGVDGATQTRLDYLPEHATDFAFASLSEQRGFAGVSVLLLLYLLVVWRGLKIITIARDAYSAIVAAGLVFVLLFQLHQRRHGDGDRAGDWDHAAVRQRRRIVARGQPRGDRRARGDLHPRPPPLLSRLDPARGEYATYRPDRVEHAWEPDERRQEHDRLDNHLGRHADVQRDADVVLELGLRPALRDERRHGRHLARVVVERRPRVDVAISELDQKG